MVGAGHILTCDTCSLCSWQLGWLSLLPTGDLSGSLGVSFLQSLVHALGWMTSQRYLHLKEDGAVQSPAVNF